MTQNAPGEKPKRLLWRERAVRGEGKGCVSTDKKWSKRAESGKNSFKEGKVWSGKSGTKRGGRTETLQRRAHAPAEEKEDAHKPRNVREPLP